MGNTLLSPCLKSQKSSSSSSTTLIFWEGMTRILKGKHIAGEIMFEFPDKIICHADSFFIGHPLPVLSIDDDLNSGQTYFVLPIDCFSCNVLTVASLAALNQTASNKMRQIMKIRDSPFVYIKGKDGRMLIKVAPEFMIALSRREKEEEEEEEGRGFLCSTPELRKHYEQLVGCKEQAWSPKLATISEHKIRYSPCRFIGLEWKEKEKDHEY